MKQLILLDCDPGLDDILAILHALNDPNLQLIGISIVAGNTTVDNGVRNALNILELTGRGKIPVARGASAPLKEKLLTGGLVHGKNGFGEIELPPPEIKPTTQEAFEFLYNNIRKRPGEVTLIATGPLTNIALLIQKHPDVISLMKKLVVMGGAVDVPGNVTRFAEYNFFADPLAANKCLQIATPKILVPLDVTTSFVFTPKDLDDLPITRSLAGSVIRRIFNFYFQLEAPYYGKTGCFLHDPLAIAAASDISIFEVERTCLRVDHQNPQRRGNVLKENSNNANVISCKSVQVQTFLERFKAALTKYFV